MIILSSILIIGVAALFIKLAISAIVLVSTLFLGAFAFILCPILICLIIGGIIFALIIICKLLGALARAF